MNDEYQPRTWMKQLLAVAGAYNLLFGVVSIFAASWLLETIGVEATPVAQSFWQCIGMIVGVYGIGYLIASRSPYRHWPITFVGLLGKVFGPIGLVFAVEAGSLPSSMAWVCLANDLIWWVPFGMILWGAVRYSQIIGSAYDDPEADDPLRTVRSQNGFRLDELADETPQLVVFLRHAGCTFCRQALSDLSKQRSKIEAAGCGIVLVHLGQSSESDAHFFQQYGLADLPRISDPTSRLYRQFGLDLGGFSALFGARVWLRGLIAGWLGGHGIGRIQGNSFQMPGVYLYHCGQILGGFRHELASDRPDYLSLVESTLVKAPDPAPAAV